VVRRSPASRSSRIGLVGVTLLLLAACSVGDRDDNQTSSSSTHSNADETETTKRPFRTLDTDEPGGPRHVRPITAEPSSEILDAAAHAPPTRLSAETFAILINHAIKDQTHGSRGDSVLTEFGRDVPADSIASVEETRMFPGDRIVPGGRSWLRSSFRTTSAGTEATVDVVEKIEAPTSALSTPDDSYIYWARATLTLAWAEDQWHLVDYQSAIASEYEHFSNNTWRGVMDSGHDWRRFDVAGAP
jgi:hypothetical protein